MELRGLPSCFVLSEGVRFFDDCVFMELFLSGASCECGLGWPKSG